MSQAKMDEYKEYKKNRKQILQKEKQQKKRNRIIGWTVTSLLGLALVAALGITGYHLVKDSLDARPDYDREELVIADIAGALDAEEEETTSAE